MVSFSVAGGVCEKVAQNVAKPFLCQNYHIAGTVEKAVPIQCATSVIFKPQPKESNRTIGEKSPNLVTLMTYFPQTSTTTNIDFWEELLFSSEVKN
jgi:hypothetical protein